MCWSTWIAAAAFWSAPVLWRFGAGSQSSRGLPHSKTQAPEGRTFGIRAHNLTPSLWRGRSPRVSLQRKNRAKDAKAPKENAGRPIFLGASLCHGEAADKVRQSWKSTGWPKAIASSIRENPCRSVALSCPALLDQVNSPTAHFLFALFRGMPNVPLPLPENRRLR